MELIISGIGVGIEQIETKLIELVMKDLELKDLELNEKELSIWYFYDTAKDILQTVESIAVWAMVFSEQEKLDNEVAGQILPSN